MNFERHKDPKTQMGVGLAAKAKEIEGLAEFIMQTNGKEYVLIEDEERVIAILRQLQLNKYGSDPNDIRLLIKEVSYPVSRTITGRLIKQREERVHKIGISTAEERVVSYKDKLYIIPAWPKLWARWQEVQHVRHLYNTGQFKLA